MTMDLIRAGDFADRVSFYRHDLNFGLSGVPANPHAFFNTTQRRRPDFYPHLPRRPSTRPPTFFESDGATFANLTPTELWETPIAFLREDLSCTPPAAVTTSRAHANALSLPPRPM